MRLDSGTRARCDQMSRDSRIARPRIFWKYDPTTFGLVIGYYVHHRGAGHLHRALAVTSALDSPVTILSSLPRPASWTGGWVDLPLDTDTEPLDPAAGGALHWAPLDSAGLRARMAAISAWVVAARPTVVVVDVSVEVAVVVRLHGVQVITFAQPGDRIDRAHSLGYQLSAAVIAPWTPGMRPCRVDPALELTFEHVGAISRIPIREPGTRRAHRVAVLNGTGGHGSSALDAVVAQSTAASPGLEWVRLEGASEAAVQDTLNSVCLVIAHCGQNVVAEIAACRVPAILVPEDRPHEEQRYLARALEGSTLPVIISAPDDGSDRAADIDRGRALDGERWRSWVDGRAAIRAGAGLRCIGRQSKLSKRCSARWHAARAR